MKISLDLSKPFWNHGRRKALLVVALVVASAAIGYTQGIQAGHYDVGPIGVDDGTKPVNQVRVEGLTDNIYMKHPAVDAGNPHRMLTDIDLNSLTAGVKTFNGRSGTVVLQAGDIPTTLLPAGTLSVGMTCKYTASMNIPNVSLAGGTLTGVASGSLTIVSCP